MKQCYEGERFSKSHKMRQNAATVKQRRQRENEMNDKVFGTLERKLKFPNVPVLDDSLDLRFVGGSRIAKGAIRKTISIDKLSALLLMTLEHTGEGWYDLKGTDTITDVVGNILVV